jgi:hypothetical protein
MATGIGGFFFGGKPEVPEFTQVNPNTIQEQTISGNLAALPGATKLASQVNQFNLDQILKALEFAAPGALGKAQTNVSNQLSGVLDPADTQSVIRNATAAGYGKGFGFGVGSIGRNLVARDLGLSVQGVKQQGLQNFFSLAKATSAPQFDIGSMFFTPSQRLATAIQQNENKFNRDWLQAQIDASPNPAGAWVMEFTMEVVKALASSAGSAAAGCWIARECYGEDNPRWCLFWLWLHTKAPKWFRNAYQRFGERVAKAIRPFPMVKAMIRSWMNRRIEQWL